MSLKQIAARRLELLRREQDLPADHPVIVLTDSINRLNSLPARHASNEDENRAIIRQLVDLRDRLRQGVA